MKISFLCSSLSREFGGIFETSRSLAKWLSFLPDTQVDVLGVEDAHTEQDLALWSPIKPSFFPYSGNSTFRYSTKLRDALLARNSDIVHMHALWTHNSVILNQWRNRWRRPYLITANGMLDPWAVRNSGMKKRIAMLIYESRCLRNAACLHALSIGELKAIRSLGLSNPVCVIPNGIDLPSTDAAAPNPFPAGQKTLLYLGRLHPKKGLANLLKAWAAVDNRGDWTLAIAGWDQAGHERELIDLTTRLGLNSSVSFLGSRFGDDKAACYRHCDAFILPSFSEGLPMVVLEAWSYRKPVLMTAACNLPEGFSAGSAIEIYPEEQSIAAGLNHLFALSDSERQAMGDSGFSLVEKQFTWPKIAQNLRSVYGWMLGSGPRPDFVVTN